MVEQKAVTAKMEILPSSRMSMKMKNKLRRRRTSSTGVLGRRVTTLKRLIPNCHKGIGVDGLFRETAEYILSLQLKVRLMQTMIDLVSNPDTD